MIRLKYLLGFFLFCVLFIVHPSHTFSAAADKDKVLAKYEQAMALTEENRLSQKNIQAILPKVRFAGQAILKTDYETADRVLTEALLELDKLQKEQPPAAVAEFRLEWLETYMNVFQWFAVITILAFFFVKWRLFRTMLLKNRIPWWGQGALALLAAFFAIVLSVFDLSRYGESAWMFFDIQIVLVTASGLFGGLLTGLVAGALVALFRFVLDHGWSVYPVLSFAAGLIGGVFALGLRNFQQTGGRALGAGLSVGVLHGLCVYLPVDPVISWSYIIFAVTLLAVLEGAGVFLFSAVVSGTLREETRRRMQYEFLKTRLLLLQAQLRPHFLFNALNTIAAVCGEGDAAKGETLVVKLSNFLRHTFGRKEEMVTLREEMAFVDTYLDIEAARFGEKLTVVKNIELSEKAWGSRVPILVLQPLVENAVKHGTSKRPEGGAVWITIAEGNEGLKFEVSDNGPGKEEGFFKALLRGEAVADDVGIGVRNIHERLIQLYGSDCGLQYASQPGQGTRVTFWIPSGAVGGVS